MEGIDVQAIVRQAIQDYTTLEQAKNEPAYKAELIEERKRREQLERRVNELVEENRVSRKMAEEADRSSAVRAQARRTAGRKPRSLPMLIFRSRSCPAFPRLWPDRTTPEFRSLTATTVPASPS